MSHTSRFPKKNYFRIRFVQTKIRNDHGASVPRFDNPVDSVSVGLDQICSSPDVFESTHLLRIWLFRLTSFGASNLVSFNGGKIGSGKYMGKKASSSRFK